MVEKQKLFRLITIAVIFSSPLLTTSLENGLARTPPMGFLAWERFRCNIDCVDDPDNCISENLFKIMADFLVSEGYAAVGYEYVNIDDCWLADDRDASGRLRPAHDRFPSGIKALADYIHGKGLKFGIYESFGFYTCEGYPGVNFDTFEIDANTFAEWGVDYVKLDGCYARPKDMDRGYTEFGRYLNKTGRPMIYSCSWPVYQAWSGINPNYTKIIEACNLWRNWADIQDSWPSVLGIIDYYGNNQDDIIPNAGPGHWNDPDMIIAGNFGLSFEQSRTQFAIWAILASPLLLSVDLRTVTADYKAILQNKKIIAVNQDVLGIQGSRVYKKGSVEIWTRPITPVILSKHYSYAVVFTFRGTGGTPTKVTQTLIDLGLHYKPGYRVEDLYTNKDYGFLFPDDEISVYVNPTGCVMLKFTVAGAL